jgi:hypothetical protein
MLHESPELRIPIESGREVDDILPIARPERIDERSAGVGHYVSIFGPRADVDAAHTFCRRFGEPSERRPKSQQWPRYVVAIKVLEDIRAYPITLLLKNRFRRREPTPHEIPQGRICEADVEPMNDPELIDRTPRARGNTIFQLGNGEE